MPRKAGDPKPGDPISGASKEPMNGQERCLRPKLLAVRGIGMQRESTRIA